MSANKIDMIGKIYNQWKVLEFSYKKNKKTYYRCKCLICNNFFIVDGANIRLARSKCCIKCSAKKPKGTYEAGTKRCKFTVEEAKPRYLFTKYKKEAKRRGREFSLSFERFEELIFKKCEYCGIEPSNTINIFKNHDMSKEKEDQGMVSYNGIDRIDSSKGYIEGNVRTCCKHCNYAKLERSEEEFKAWITRVYNHLNS